jgi:c-di-GMP-binding flagellar brake protein YcgR
MKITDIDTDNKLLLKFKYKEKSYSMVVVLFAKNAQHIIIPSILENNLVVNPEQLKEVEIIYTVMDGIFRFGELKMESAFFKGIRVYNVSSDEDITRSNRREAYRMFIGELMTVTVVMENGNKRNIEGILKNISVTGMSVVLKQEFEIGTTMRILYNFEGLNFYLQGTVIRKDKMKGYRAFSYGCIFKDPNHSINRVIIQKQIRNKKNNT